MSLTLTSTINSTALSLRVTGTVPADLEAPYLFRLDDEVLLLRAFGKAWDGGRQKWLVKRHQEGTAAASHTSGATVKAVTSALVAGDDEDLPDPFASDGGEPVALDAVLAVGNATGEHTIDFPLGYINAVTDNAEIDFVGNDGGAGEGGVDILVLAGAGNDGATDGAELNVGAGHSTTTGGDGILSGGNGSGGSRAQLQAAGGNSGGGGAVNLITGSGIAGDASGGDATVLLGSGFGSGRTGWFVVTTTTTENPLLIVTHDNVILPLASLPTSDPLVAGALFSDGAAGPGSPVALKISGGPS